MRVLIICPNLEGGGEEFRVRRLAKFLIAKKIDVRILTKRGFYLLNDEFYHKTYFFRNLIFCFNTNIFAFKRWSLLPLFFLKYLNSNYYFNVANIYRGKKWLNFLMPSKNIISISEYVHKSTMVIELGNDKYKKFNSNWKYNNTNSIEILWIGKDNWHKGFDLLLKLLNQYEKIRFNICGLFTQENIKFLSKIDNANFCGWVDDFSFFTKKNIIYIQTSNQEGFPNVLVENMQLGIPIIASDVGASSEIIRGYGETFNKGNYIELCEKLNYCISNYKKIRKNSITGIEYAKNRFDEEKMLNSYFQLCNKKK